MKEKVVRVLEEEYLLPFMDISGDGGCTGQVYIAHIWTVGPNLPCHHGPFLVIIPHDCIGVHTSSTTCP